MIKILSYTKQPVTTIGQYSGKCYGQTNPKRFKKIGEQILKENHGRAQEFVDIVFEFDGVSAKMVRELFRHKMASELQASTRYIDYSKQYDEIIPPSVKRNEDARVVWGKHSEDTLKTICELKELGIPTEDFSNKLPISYETNGVYKINLRSLIHAFGVRSCTCAYHEFRDFMRELKKEIAKLDEEWLWISDNYFHPKCIGNLWCDEEKRNCGLRPKKSDVKAFLEHNKELLKEFISDKEA